METGNASENKTAERLGLLCCFEPFRLVGGLKLSTAADQGVFFWGYQMSIHSFDVLEAEKYGVIPAILLFNIRFWVQKNAANRKHFYEGRYWTYNSVAAFSELFPYLTKDQVRRALEKLEESGAIKTGCFNSSPYDRTKWFTCHCDMANLPNENGENAKSLTVTDINTDTSAPVGASSGSKLPDCPHQAIIDAYHEALPECPRVREWTEARKRLMKTRWAEKAKDGKYKTQQEGIAYWKRFFQHVAGSAFLTGRVSGRDGQAFIANLEWLIRPGNFAKVVEGNYHKD